MNMKNENYKLERYIIEYDTVVNVWDMFFEGYERLLFYAGFT